jgi:hypothetical protein
LYKNLVEMISNIFIKSVYSFYAEYLIFL